jgi:hypothetical protein
VLQLPGLTRTWTVATFTGHARILGEGASQARGRRFEPVRRSLHDNGKIAEAVAWTPEGHLWVRAARLQGLPTRIFLYDVTKRRVLGERAFSLNDATGVLAVNRVLGTPDAGALAFDYERVLGHLYLLDGLAPY